MQGVEIGVARMSGQECLNSLRRTTCHLQTWIEWTWSKTDCRACTRITESIRSMRTLVVKTRWKRSSKRIHSSSNTLKISIGRIRSLHPSLRHPRPPIKDLLSSSQRRKRNFRMRKSRTSSTTSVTSRPCPLPANTTYPVAKSWSRWCASASSAKTASSSGIFFEQS